MSPLSPEEILNPNVGVKEKLASWAASQGVSTVLLLLIMAGVWFGRSDIVTQIQNGYDRNAASLEKAVLVVQKQFDRVAEQGEADRKLLIEILRERQNSSVASGK
jgi:hypothetical protein